MTQTRTQLGTVEEMAQLLSMVESDIRQWGSVQDDTRVCLQMMLAESRDIVLRHKALYRACVEAADFFAGHDHELDGLGSEEASLCMDAYRKAKGGAA